MRTEIDSTASATLIAMRFVTREATLEDSTEIARVQVDTWRTTYRGIVPQSFLDRMDYDVRAESWRDQLAAGSSRIYVSEMDGTICGFICGGRLREPLSDFDGEIYAIYLAVDAQQRGCGRAMMKQLAAKLLQEGLKSAVVWVLERNPACTFYERLGGEFLGQKAISIGGADLVEVAYGWKDLGQLAESARP
jgi:ribosomal protein S18 acetylase RimI-like enzyme